MAIFIVVDCGDPGTPANGNTTGTSTTFGSVVTHACDEGFLLVGADERECLANGTWEPLPVCMCKHNLPKAVCTNISTHSPHT